MSLPSSSPAAANPGTAQGLPDFAMIGAAKSGTTSMYRLLEQHPDVFVPYPKEPEFFARDDRYAAGLPAYKALFAGARPGQIAGDFSTIYSLAPFFDQTAARMAVHMPQARLIYVMRQPVERAYSFYVQILKNYQNVTGDLAVHRSFEAFIDPVQHRSAAPRGKVFSPANNHLPDTPELCLAGSDYPAQIQAWLAHFPRDQILFLKFEDFVADRPATLRQITDFLGVPPLSDAAFGRDDVTRNVAANHFKRRGRQRAMERLRAQLGPLWHLRRALPEGLRKGLRDRVATAISTDKSHVPPPMLEETRRQLTARFQAQQEALTDLTGLDFDSWWR